MNRFFATKNQTIGESSATNIEIPQLSFETLWTPNGMAICTAEDNQNFPQICSDGAGGAIITWVDDRSSELDIYTQRVNSIGDVQWALNGTAICTADNDQEDPQICSDGTGGAIITWEDRRSGADYDIYAQRIKDVPSKGGGAIPFGNYYLLFTLISILSLIILEKCRNIRKFKL